jgi:hypoxanthine-DNA glycosylase
MDTNNIRSLPPLCNSESKIIIVGTMPGQDSITKNQYYANQDNIFWNFILKIFLPVLLEENYSVITYDEKVSVLLKNHLALWDILEHCERKGNLDKNIRNAHKNDFITLFRTHPNIKTIIFNGQKAFKFFIEQYPTIAYDFHIKSFTLPSTSPSYQMNCFQKLLEWKKVLITVN